MVDYLNNFEVSYSEFILFLRKIFYVSSILLILNPIVIALTSELFGIGIGNLASVTLKQLILAIYLSVGIGGSLLAYFELSLMMKQGSTTLHIKNRISNFDDGQPLIYENTFFKSNVLEDHIKYHFIIFIVYSCVLPLLLTLMIAFYWSTNISW